MANTEQPWVLSSWTHYFKNQSITGKLGLTKEQYPALTTFIDDLGNADDMSIPPLAMYDMLCQVVCQLEKISTFCDTAIAKCKQEIASLINKNGQPKRGNPNKILAL